jgi:hypothetical protein
LQIAIAYSLKKGKDIKEALGKRRRSPRIFSPS